MNRMQLLRRRSSLLGDNETCVSESFVLGDKRPTVTFGSHE